MPPRTRSAANGAPAKPDGDWVIVQTEAASVPEQQSQETQVGPGDRNPSKKLRFNDDGNLICEFDKDEKYLRELQNTIREYIQKEDGYNLLVDDIYSDYPPTDCDLPPGVQRKVDEYLAKLAATHAKRLEALRELGGILNFMQEQEKGSRDKPVRSALKKRATTGTEGGVQQNEVEMADADEEEEVTLATLFDDVV